jgi:hypothetical protein
LALAEMVAQRAVQITAPQDQILYLAPSHLLAEDMARELARLRQAATAVLAAAVVGLAQGD